jgi:hypothetical protein
MQNFILVWEMVKGVSKKNTLLKPKVVNESKITSKLLIIVFISAGTMILSFRVYQVWFDHSQ